MLQMGRWCLHQDHPQLVMQQSRPESNVAVHALSKAHWRLVMCQHLKFKHGEFSNTNSTHNCNPHTRIQTQAPVSNFNLSMRPQPNVLRPSLPSQWPSCQHP